MNPKSSAEAMLVDPASLCVGRTIWSVTRSPITRSDIVRYAGASGDFTPIHHDEPLAQAAGNPSVFAMGLYPAGILASLVTDHFGVLALRRFGVRFTDKIWPGDVLTYSGRVSRVGDEIELELLVRDQAGNTKVTGSAIVSPASRATQGEGR